MAFTMVYKKVPEGYIGFIEELPGANSQANTLNKLKENLKEAVQLILEANKVMSEEMISGQKFSHEKFNIATL
jgi:predicted RNase H-like HicB family nuclease